MSINDHLDIDHAGMEELIKSEGNVLYPYQDVAALWTIGVGHLILPTDSFSCLDNAHVREMLQSNGHKLNPNPYKAFRISKEESMEILHRDAQRFVRAVRAAAPNTPLSQHMFNALVSFAFNVGAGWLQKGGVRAALDRHDYQGVCTALLAFSKAKVNGKVVTIPGLLTRRQREVALFCKPVEEVHCSEIAHLDEATLHDYLEAVGHANERLTCQDAGDVHEHEEGADV